MLRLRLTRAILALPILAALLGVAGPAAASLQDVPPADALAAGPLHAEPLAAALGPEEPEFGLYELGAPDLLALAHDASPNISRDLEALASEALIDAKIGSQFEPVRPKNRIGAFDFLGGVCIGVWSTVTPELHWGCERADVGIVSELFQGAWTDPVTGLAYHRQRWYDPRTASWLSEDAYGDIDSPNLYAYVGWGPNMATDPMGLATAPQVGWVYRIEGVLNGQNVVYVGSAADLKNRLGPEHKWEQLLRKRSTTISVRKVFGELDIASSGRGTFASARNEALRAAEQEALDEARAEVARQNASRAKGQRPTRVLNEIEAAEDPALFAQRHGVTSSRAWSRIKASGGSIGFPILAVATAISGAYRQAIEEREARFIMAPYVLEDEGGVFTVETEENLLSADKHFKVYRDGKKKGERVGVSAEEFATLKAEAEALWGTLDSRRDFVPGLLNPELQLEGGPVY